MPKRIISVVPSQTELLADLGLEEEVVGITRFCVHPERWFRSKTRVGGTKRLNIKTIRSLSPDLIIANKEENEQAQIEALSREFPVWVSDIRTLDDALEMINLVGELTGRASVGVQMAEEIRSMFSGFRGTGEMGRVAYFIWYRPWMVAGGDTFIHDILGRVGWKNVFADRLRYPETTLEELQALNPGLVLLSSEPFPFSEKHVEELRDVLPHAEIRLVDGEMFSWYGSRLLRAGEYLRTFGG